MLGYRAMYRPNIRITRCLRLCPLTQALLGSLKYKATITLQMTDLAVVCGVTKDVGTTFYDARFSAVRGQENRPFFCQSELELVIMLSLCCERSKSRPFYYQS